MLPLHTEGRHIKDSAGNIVYLKGLMKVDHTDTGVGWWTTPGQDFAISNYAHWDEVAVRAHLETMKNDWGINCLAILFWMDWYKRNAKETISTYWPTTDRGARDCLIDVVRLAEEYGIYVILWAYGVTPTEGRTMMPFPPYHNGSVFPDVQAFVNFWLDVANDLKAYSNVIFHLYDEPFTNTGYPDEWFDAAEQVLNALRNAGHDNIVLIPYSYCGSYWWVDDWTSQGRPTYNVVFNNHIYRYHGTFVPASPTDLNSIRDQITGRLMYSHVLNDLKLPILVGAIGAFDGIHDDAEYDAFKNSLIVLNELEVGFCGFKWHRHDTAWALQTHEVDSNLGYIPAIQPPNRVGIALIEQIGPALTAIITGTVTDAETGQPLEGVLVEVDAYSTVTVADGTYVEQVMVGLYGLKFTKAGYAPYSIAVDASTQGTYTVDVEMIRATLTATINGTVVDAETGLPIQGVLVEIDAYSTVTAVDGTYLLEVALGEYMLTVTKAGYAPYSIAVDASTQGTYTVDMEMIFTPTLPAPLIFISAPSVIGIVGVMEGVK